MSKADDILEELEKLSIEAENLIQNNLDEEDEDDVSWIDKQKKLSDEEKLECLKSVARYYLSEEFRWIVSKYKSKIIEEDEKIREIVHNRKKTEANFSFIDRCDTYNDALSEIAIDVTNDIFRWYLEARIDSNDSMIINKKWSVMIADGVELLVDSPIFSNVDLIKARKEIYNSIEAFLKYTIAIYDYQWIVNKKDENPHQPYE